MLIELSALRKVFPAAGGFFPFGGRKPAVTALSGIGLRIESGTIMGLAGPNGSGKSTLLRVLAGRLVPDGGRILLDGAEAGDRELRAAAALAEPGARSFYPRLDAFENLRFFAALYGLSAAETRDRAGTLGRSLGLADGDMRKRFEALSEGTAQKIALLRALVLRPRLLLLDEPARNLDAGAAAALPGLLKSFAAEGRTVIYASHDPAGLAAVCGNVAALKDGGLTAFFRVGPEDAAAAIPAACAGTL